MPVAFWNTEKAVWAKSGFSFLGLLAFGLRFAFGMIVYFALGVGLALGVIVRYVPGVG
jgi:hypothetical protein